MAAVKIPLNRFEQFVEWGDADSIRFAYCCGINPGRDEVSEVKRVERDEAGTWTDLLEQDSWLDSIHTLFGPKGPDP